MKINWTDEHQKVIDETVEYLKSPNVIAYPDFNVPFIVHCDASQDGLGAALYQKQGGEIRIISLASRTLTPAERNYFMHSGKLEFLALKWSITEKFKDYLINGPPFEVVTDNNPLTYVLTTAKLNSTGLRWIADFANYQFSIRYRSGKKHLDADHLSRNVIDDFIELKGSVDKYVEVEDINVVLTSAFRKEKLIDYVMVESVEVKCDGKFEKIGKKDLIDEQKEDKVIATVYKMRENGMKLKICEKKCMNKESIILMKQTRKLSIEEGVLVRKMAKFKHIVLPQKFHYLVYSELH